jgi:hypothetical protein
MSAIRTWVLAAGTAALLSSQALSAPVNRAPAVDPLLAVSALSTGKSPVAACGTTGCLPATSVSVVLPAATTSAAAAQGAPYEPRPIDWPGLAVLFSFPLVLILAMALEDDGEDITVISPG